MQVHINCIQLLNIQLPAFSFVFIFLLFLYASFKKQYTLINYNLIKGFFYNSNFTPKFNQDPLNGFIVSHFLYILMIQNRDAQWGEKSYWDARYEIDNGRYEWYQNFAGLKEFIGEKIEDKDSRILFTGCGNSSMYDHIYRTSTKVMWSKIYKY